MSENKKTYGVSLNSQNEYDPELMDWLEKMKYGEPSRIIREGLILKYEVDNGLRETVPVGTIEALQSEINSLRAQLSQPSAAAIPDALLRLIERQNAIQERQAKALERLANTGIAAGAPQGTNAPVVIDDEREDPNDPLVLAMMGMDFSTAFSD